jgi:hypothetical protein
VIYFHAGQAILNSSSPSSCSDKVDESSFYVSPSELNANSISDIIALGYVVENLHLKKTA